MKGGINMIKTEVFISDYKFPFREAKDDVITQVNNHITKNGILRKNILEYKTLYVEAEELVRYTVLLTYWNDPE